MARKGEDLVRSHGGGGWWCRHRVLAVDRRCRLIGVGSFVVTGSLQGFETVRAVAERLGYHPSAVRRMCSQGRFLCQKLGQQWLIARGSLPDQGQPPSQLPPLGYMTVSQAALLWGWERSSVLQFCYQGRILGAIESGKPFRGWLIPRDTPPPPRRRPQRRPQRCEVGSK